MKNHLRLLLASVALLCNASQSFANFAMSPSGATTAFAIDAANQGTALCAAASTECPASILVNTAGAPIGVAAVPLQVSLANTAANGTALKVDGSAVTQPVSLTSTTITGTVALVANQSTNEAQINGVTPLMGNGVTGTGSQRVTISSDNTAFAVNAASTLAAETIKVIGTTRTLGNVGAVIDFVGQAATAPANAWLTGGTFFTTPTTLTNGQASPLQMDNAGNLLVNIKTGASSGAVAQGSTTSGQTGLLMQCAVTTAAPTYTTAQTDPCSLDTTGSLRVNVTAGPPGLAQGSATSGQTGSMIMGAVTTGAPSYTTAQTAYASLTTLGSLRTDNATVLGVATPVGSGVMATAPRMALATDSPGIIATGGATTALSLPVALNSQYPVNSVTTAPTGITGNATGTTGAVVGTLAAAASVTTFICGFNVQAIGGTAAIGPVTVAGLIGSSQVYQASSTAAGGKVAGEIFSPCIPASAVNTAITITTTADGTATAVDVNSWGYRL